MLNSFSIALLVIIIFYLFFGDDIVHVILSWIIEIVTLHLISWCWSVSLINHSTKIRWSVLYVEVQTMYLSHIHISFLNNVYTWIILSRRRFYYHVLYKLGSALKKYIFFLLIFMVITRAILTSQKKQDIINAFIQFSFLICTFHNDTVVQYNLYIIVAVGKYITE